MSEPAAVIVGGGGGAADLPAPVSSSSRNLPMDEESDGDEGPMHDLEDNAERLNSDDLLQEVMMQHRISGEDGRGCHWWRHVRGRVRDSSVRPRRVKGSCRKLSVRFLRGR